MVYYTKLQKNINFYVTVNYDIKKSTSEKSSLLKPSELEIPALQIFEVLSHKIYIKKCAKYFTLTFAILLIDNGIIMLNN